jgi:hypothetical protein
LLRLINFTLLALWLDILISIVSKYISQGVLYQL